MSLQKANQNPTFYFTSKVKEEGVSEDTLPEGVTEEELKAEYAILVWCEYYGCKWNRQVGANRTLGTLLKK